MRCRYLLWSVLFLFLVLFSLSQNRLADLPALIKKYREADAWYNKALEVNTDNADGERRESMYNKIALQQFRVVETLITQKGRGFDSLHFYLSLKAGELAHYFDSLPLALHYYTLAILLKTSLPAFADSLVFKAYLFSGHIYFYHNQLDSAAFCFKKAEDIQDRYARKLQESERLYNDLGVMYFQGGNYFQAGNYFRKAAEMLKRSSPYFNDFWVNYNINYAIALFKMDHYDSAYSILQGLLPMHSHLNEIYNNLGLIDERQGRHQKAIAQYRHVKYQNALCIGLENDRAAAWLSLRQYDSARGCLNTSLHQHEKYNGTNTSVDHGLTCKLYGDLQTELHEYKSALAYYQEALHQFYPSFRDTSIYLNPPVFSGVFSYINLFHALVAKAAVFHHLYIETHDARWAREELRSFEACFQLTDYIEKVYESDEARLFLEKSKYQVHQKPIDIAFELYKKTRDGSFLEKAYELDQRAKASILALNDQRNSFIKPNSSLRQKELSLRKEITHLSLTANSFIDTGSIEAAARQIRELEIKLGKVQDAIAEITSSLSVTVPTIKNLQKKLLDPHTRLISYHLGDHQLTTFSITSSDFTASQQAIYPRFFKDLETFLHQLYNSSDTISADTSSQRLSAFLLNGLLDKDHSRLIIIPDDELNFLPFEALTYAGTYLVENFSIQYNYSTSLLKKETTDFQSASTVSFAPFTTSGYTDSRVQFPSLPYSQEEIKDVRGISFSGRLATKKMFLENMNRGDIIHLATHALAGADTSGPSFVVFAPWDVKTKNDYLLYATEIYNLPVQHNKLIILSACQTGYGKLVKGEGVMSLGRAFAYAGCPDIIASLWKADDEATAFLSRRIHFYLGKGMAIDQAIQKAKKDYLSDYKINPRRKQPAYWAHLIFAGNYKPIAGNFPWIWVMCGTGLLIIVIIFTRKILWRP